MASLTSQLRKKKKKPMASLTSGHQVLLCWHKCLAYHNIIMKRITDYICNLEIFKVSVIVATKFTTATETEQL